MGAAARADGAERVMDGAAGGAVRPTRRATRPHAPATAIPTSPATRPTTGTAIGSDKREGARTGAMPGVLPAISVVGLGYVGAVSMGCLAALGHRMVGVDLEPGKAASIGAGQLGSVRHTGAALGDLIDELPAMTCQQGEAVAARADALLVTHATPGFRALALRHPATPIVDACRLFDGSPAFLTTEGIGW